MTSLTLRRNSGLVQSCRARFYRPAEYDGPGTMEIFEFRCVLRHGHRGHHQVEEIR